MNPRQPIKPEQAQHLLDAINRETEAQKRKRLKRAQRVASRYRRMTKRK